MALVLDQKQQQQVASAATGGILLSELYEVVCRSDSVKLRSYLNSSQGDVNALIQDPQGRRQTMLQLAARLENFDVASVLLGQRWIKLSTVEGSDFPSPLHLCCMWKVNAVSGKVQMGSTRIANLLLAKGADPNGSDDVPLTPLHLALMNGNSGLVKTLLAAGASVKRGLKVSLFCCAWGWCVEGLFLLHSADPTTVASFLAKPLNTHNDYILNVVCDTTWYNPGYCFRDNSLEPFERQVFFVDAACSLGATVDTQCMEGRTPLHHAWKNSNAFLAYHLMCSANAAIDLHDCTGILPLQYHTSLSGSTSLVLSGRMNLHTLLEENMVKLLLKRGVADLNLVAPESDATALHYAVENPKFAEKTSLIQSMLEAGSDPNSKNDSGETPLFLAVRHRRSPPFIRTLIDGGADPSVPSPTEIPLQLLGQVEPYFGISQVAMLLIEFDKKLDLYALSTIGESHKPFLELETVQKHPHWYEFRKWVKPTRDPKQQHREEREHFEACTALGISPLPWKDPNAFGLLLGVGDDATGGVKEEDEEVAVIEKDSTTSTRPDPRHPFPPGPLTRSSVAAGQTDSRSQVDTESSNAVVVDTSSSNVSVTVVNPSELKPTRGVAAGQRNISRIQSDHHHSMETVNQSLRSTLTGTTEVLEVSKGEWEELEGTPYYRRQCLTKDGIPFQQISTKLSLSTTDFIPFNKQHAMIIKYGEELYKPMESTQSHIAAAELERSELTEAGSGGPRVEGDVSGVLRPQSKHTTNSVGVNKTAVERLTNTSTSSLGLDPTANTPLDRSTSSNAVVDNRNGSNLSLSSSSRPGGPPVIDFHLEADWESLFEFDFDPATTPPDEILKKIETKRQCTCLEELIERKLAERVKAINKHDDIRFLYRTERACARTHSLETAREEMLQNMEIIRQKRVAAGKSPKK